MKRKLMHLYHEAVENLTTAFDKGNWEEMDKWDNLASEINKLIKELEK